MQERASLSKDYSVQVYILTMSKLYPNYEKVHPIYVLEHPYYEKVHPNYEQITSQLQGRRSDFF